ncbi:MAG: GtrA family protein [Oceanospirillaceae bacterium]
MRFACVGSIGFCVDALSLVLLAVYLPLPIARALSFWIAASSNWWLNRNFTFKHTSKQHCDKKKRASCRQWLLFLCVSCIGFIPNWLCYVLLIEHFIWAEQMPVIAIIPGILLSMFLNYTLSKCWVFK